MARSDKAKNWRTLNLRIGHWHELQELHQRYFKEWKLAEIIGYLIDKEMERKEGQDVD